MAEFNIVHLSDLHIKNGNTETKEEFETGQRFIILRNLIDDIENRTKNMHNIILVVTGDIVNVGNFSNLNDESLNPTLQFFRKLFRKFIYESEGLKPSY